MDKARVLDRAREYALLMRLDRPIGILLLLWPTLWALWIAAEGDPAPHIVVIFVLGVIVMRSAGCVINDYADRDIDPHVIRTRNRPIAAGRATPREALGLFVVLCLVALILVLLLNPLVRWLSIVGVILAASYPFTKRYTYLPQVHLGFAFGWAVPMAFAAVTGAVPPLAWLMLIAVVLWAVAYDTMYAMVDRPDDLRIGVKSTAILFGSGDRYVVAGIQATVILVLLIIGDKADLGFYYHLGVGAAVALSVYQQYLIRDRAPQGCFKAFLNNNWLGAAVFVGIVLDFLLTTQPD